MQWLRFSKENSNSAYLLLPALEKLDFVRVLNDQLSWKN